MNAIQKIKLIEKLQSLVGVALDDPMNVDLNELGELLTTSANTLARDSKHKIMFWKIYYVHIDLQRLQRHKDEWDQIIKQPIIEINDDETLCHQCFEPTKEKDGFCSDFCEKEFNRQLLDEVDDED